MTPGVRTLGVPAITLLLAVFAGAGTARADVVLDWNAIAARTVSVQNPFAQARTMAITQLAVFEAVNAILGGYEPYGTGIAPEAGASAEAAAIAAAHAALVEYVPAATAALDADLAASLAAIADGPAKSAGIAGEWQTTPPCSPAGGAFAHWPNVTPFGIPDAASFILGPPPDLTSNEYAKHFADVKKYGALNSTARPADRADVARFYASVSPSGINNETLRQLASARGDSLAENARNLAILNMSISDSLVVSFATKYRYNLWRPETAIRAGDSDGNGKTAGDPGFAPFIATPCFPSYPSNHASGTNGGLEVLRRLFGAAGHSLTLTNASLGVTRHYTSFKQIADDVDDARVYGGIHFWFDQEGGNRLGRAVATYVVKHNLQRLAAQ